MDLDKFGTSADVQELLAIRDRIENLIDSGRDATPPKVDLLDLGDAFRVVVEVPGVDESDLELALQGNTLVVAGLREPAATEARILFSERQTGHFQRSVELPGAVDRERTSAHLQGGLLTVDLPKE